MGLIDLLFEVKYAELLIKVANRLIVRIKLLFGIYPFTLYPLHNIEPEDGIGFFRSISNDPQFLATSKTKSIPEGWCTLECDLETITEAFDPKIYIDLGSGFSEDTAIKLVQQTGSKGTWVIYLPRGIKFIRFDPCSSVGVFKVNKFTITQFNILRILSLGVKRLSREKRTPSQFFKLGRKILRMLIKDGAKSVLDSMLYRPQQNIDAYETWIQLYDTINEYDRHKILQHIDQLNWKPKISIILPVYNPPEKYFRQALDSVINQIYKNWELCISDDASTSPWVRNTIEEYTNKDVRIKAVFRTVNGHISEASNSALSIATGEYIGLLDQDDVLTEHALYFVVNELNCCPDSEIIYSDEDKVDEGGHRYDPYFKPDWNPDLLNAQNYINHFVVFRLSIFQQVGGFRMGLEGAQDWDLVLRISERIASNTIRHIPHILYHWRAIETSTAVSVDNKQYALTAQYATLVSHFERIGSMVNINRGFGGYWRETYLLKSPFPLVSIIIPTKNKKDLLEICINSILDKTTYKNYEILIIDNQSDDESTKEYLSSLTSAEQISVIKYNFPFNYSSINNYAVEYSKGDIILFLNNDIQVISPNWMDELVGQACRPEIGAAGAMLYYPDDRIQHAGVILGMGGVAGHIYLQSPRGHQGQMGRAQLTQNYSSVTGACMAVRKELFVEVGGFNAKDLPIAFNDIDFCIRLKQKGYWNVWTPYAELYHNESASRGLEDTPDKQARFAKEVEYMRHQWRDLLDSDPAYNPNLTLERSDSSLAFPPRSTKPWLHW